MEEKEGKKVLLLFVQEERVNGLVYKWEEKRLTIVALGEEQGWDGQTYPSFKEAAVKSLETRWPGREETGQAFFVISPFWTVESQKLMTSKSEILKTLCREYRLPIGGFLIDDESLIFYLQKEEEAPPSFLSLLILKDGFRLSLIHLGKIKKRLKLKSSVLSAQKIREGLDQLNFEGVLPPKFIIWGKIDPDLEEEMLSYPWVDEKGDLFLHLPDIQIFDWPQLGEVFKGIVASQSELAKKDQSLLGLSEKKRKKELKSLEIVEEKGFNLPPGFSFEDLSLKEEASLSLPRTEKEIKEKFSLEKKESFFSKKISFLKNKLAVFSFWNKKGRGAWIFKGGFLFFTGLMVFGFFGLEREVFLYLTPNEEETEVEVLLAAGKVSGEEVLKAKQIVVEEESSGEGLATGSNLIGEKAKGKLTVFNRTNNPASFATGTRAVGPNQLAFVFLEEVKIASKTPDLLSGVDRWGEKEVQAEAAQIGSEYNLAADSVFNIEGEKKEDYLVKNKESLSGGTSREVTAVSQKDLDSLEEELKNKIQEKIGAELEKQAKDNQRLIEETLKTEIISFSTNKKAGEEGEEFSGQLRLKAACLALDEEELTVFAQEKLLPQALADFKINQKEIEVEFLPIEEEKDGWRGKMTIRGKFYPQLDSRSLVKAIRGKPQSRLLEEVKKQPRVYRYELKTPLRFFSFFPFLPLLEEKITVIVEQ